MTEQRGKKFTLPDLIVIDPELLRKAPESFRSMRTVTVTEATLLAIAADLGRWGCSIVNLDGDPCLGTLDNRGDGVLFRYSKNHKPAGE